MRFEKWYTDETLELRLIFYVLQGSICSNLLNTSSDFSLVDVKKLQL